MFKNNTTNLKMISLFADTRKITAKIYLFADGNNHILEINNSKKEIFSKLILLESYLKNIEKMGIEVVKSYIPQTKDIIKTK